ncbi:OmpA family protein [Sphingobacterium sp. UT-1RO-CII-1]|uniref:OmpA/MotB family protein n=1 Tax=Sphingobacterium sp. UT-1RO-CII-1 TaxID=2995225 RepID=UPI00227D05CD|nr:OmpA family protein [Sphingobacterium sp. UT-1RO-CII-1]MCY4781174.1 OmpA family protein [Sphingobacterium sp. UT-1RO-CII-1]
MIKRRIVPIAILLATVFFSACGVSKKVHLALEQQHRDLGELYQQGQMDLAESRAKVKSLEDQLDYERKNNASLKEALARLQGSLDKSITQNTQGNVNISKLVDEINASNKYIQHLVNTKNKSDSLNMVLTNNLTRSLSREEMRDVDVKVLKGVVYISLSDNMLYRSGGYEVSEQAGETLSKIAKIIQDYRDYDVLIEGNTDTDPISKTNIRNNWDLSTLRASSVVQVLQNQYGVDPKRLTAGGRGQYNPVADNSTPDGKARNRRTQIIITPKLDQFMELIDKAPETTEASESDF